MFYTVYRTTNKLNNKFYIGKHQTENLDDGYMGSGKLLKRAIKKHGKEFFFKEILFVFDTEAEMNAKEKELVVCSEETYNLCPGGQGGWGYVNSNGFRGEYWKVISKEEQEKLQRNLLAAYKEKLKDNEWRKEFSRKVSIAQKLSYDNGRIAGFSGKKHSKEFVEKMKKINSKRQQGSKNSNFGKMWITDGVVSKTIIKSDTIPGGFRKGRVI